MKGPALVIMARAPVPGKVKTRLQPHLTPGQCASLYLAFLRDVIALAASIPSYTLFLAFTPREESALFRDLLLPEIELIPQNTSDLGRRMHGIMSQLEARGYSPLVIAGSDLPTLQPATLELALECLQGSDLCLGPCPDGGYYLVGARHAWAPVFQGIPWSTPEVFRLTMEKARAASMSVALLEECADVDTFDDLKRLQADIERLHYTVGARIPHYTKAWLKQYGLLSEK